MTKLPLLLLFFFATSVQAGGQPSLTLAEIEKLRDGDMIVKSLDTNGRPGSAFGVFKLMPVALDALFTTLICYRDYPNFMPNVARIDVNQISPSVAEADYYLDLPMKQSKRYRVRLETQSGLGNAELRWKQIPWAGVTLRESIADTEGFWLLQAESPNQTWVTYQVYTDPGPVPFGFGWIVDLLTRVSLPDVLRNTETHAILGKSTCLHTILN